MTSRSTVSMITICSMALSTIMVVMSQNMDPKLLITECYNDIAQTMTDNDGDCTSEMNAISTLIDDTFEYCAYMAPGQPKKCFSRDVYLTMMTDTSDAGYCGNHDAVSFYLQFKESGTNTNGFYEILDVQEYSKPENDNCVHVLHEETKVEYDGSGYVHTVTENKDKETTICDTQYQYTNLQQISSGELSSFTLVTASNNIDNVRAGVIMLDSGIRGLQSGWNTNSKPNSPQLIEAYMTQNGNDYTYGGK
eukprot:CAMPEP_0201572568 /NCGR_PEP_ID=MMETSP0190_2-20130828/15921_1 /ASSEMBLY_ACC=CAM_ASM_000263 /TAXON_ID=37353 /ORGANISM="Rosalina sp." /LENGTH=249 /DNA_ID=CAMNT_0047998497 /DNA_START=95 /DNA_END=841 /DNA_ORIENTATION=+